MHYVDFQCRVLLRAKTVFQPVLQPGCTVLTSTVTLCPVSCVDDSVSPSVHSATLFLNVLACLAFFCANPKYGVDFGLSILWFVLFTPVAFICWYRPVYKAFRYNCVAVFSVLLSSMFLLHLVQI